MQGECSGENLENGLDTDLDKKKDHESPKRRQVVGMPDISIVSSQTELATGTSPPV